MRFAIENWLSIIVNAVYQDVHAAIFTKNLATILAHPAQSVVADAHPTHKYNYKVNVTNLISKLKDTFILLFWDNAIQSLFNSLWRPRIRTVEPIRINRSYERNKS